MAPSLDQSRRGRAKPATSSAGNLALDFSPHVLREYALLADGERGILVGPRGDFAWMCAPSWHSDAIFSTLVGGRGCYAVTPEDGRFVWGGYYEEGSLIWHDRWVTGAGVIECREALAFPADIHTAVILRRVLAPDGPARLQAILDARAGFGRQPMVDLRQERGIWTARSARLYLRWQGAPRAKPTDRGALAVGLRLARGAQRDLVLEISDRPLTGPPVEAASAWEATEAGWAQTVPQLGGTLAPRDARHAYAVMRGLTSVGGGMVAAATTSLPERAGVDRNYDYRYAWIRDQAYAGQAAAITRPDPLLDEAVSFIAERVLADGPKLKPAYRVDGGPVPDERTLRNLPGYPGGSDKVGNRANNQFQLDALGEALLLLSVAAHHDRLGTEQWRAVEVAVAAIERRWQDPDAGIWEIEDRHWAHSRLMCVAGLRGAAAQASGAQAGTWSGLADAILADVSSDCVHPSGRWQRAPDDERVDGALLLPSIRGALPPSDPRSPATLSSVRSDLGADGFVYRYRQDDRPMGQAEGAFLLCGFLMALANHQAGRDTEAIAWFERNRAACGSPGLLTEEFDVTQRQLRGNIPQAFVHALVLESAARLARPWDESAATVAPR